MKYTVFQSGYPGDNSAALLRRFERDVSPHQPGSVIVQCGTNDAVNPAAQLSAEEFAGNIRQILEKIHALGAKCMVMIPPPVISAEVIVRYKFDLEPDTDLNISLRRFTGILRNICREQHIPFLDLFKLFSVLGTETLIRNQKNIQVTDGAHPTEEGYRLIAVLTEQFLRTNDLLSERIVCFGDSMTYGYPLPGMGTLTGNNYPALLSKLLNAEETFG